MSIPKEPRQLMINLMYLVLTAMLALNVSAKIINAFFVVNDGIQANNDITDKSTKFTFEAMQRNAEQKPEEYEPLVDAAARVQEVSAEFTEYVEGIRDTLVQASGGYYPEDDKNHPGQPKGYKNKDVTTRLLVDQGMATELKSRILNARQQIIDIVYELNGAEGTAIDDANLANLESQISLEISKAYERENKPGRDTVSWEEFTFKQMPLAAVFPLLSQYSNNMKSSEAVILNFLVDQMGKQAFKVDNFIPISSPKKSYVIAGETFETNISVAANSSSINENVRIQVNGQSLPVENGTASYSVRTSGTGLKSYNVAVSLTNPTTGETEEYTETFQYEVGRRSVAVSADKMNVFYIGVDNPISVSAAGVSSNELRVSGSGGGLQLSRTGQGKYVAKVSSVGQAKVTVSGGGLTPTSFDFRVKAIPDPIARLNGETGGTIGNGTFRAQSGIFAELDNFDFEARCNIAGFTLVYAPPREDLQEFVNVGQAFTGGARNAVSQAKPGDTYYFNNVRAKCPGDNTPRKINPMVFKIR
ncbi:MAG TPA: gliding motility protein GldM [Saprospiraceae bacterium]|nr:gliding motility protein GldM [Saprospiraceae bacterium]